MHTINRCILIAVAMVCSACTAVSPRFDSQFGNAVNFAKAHQTLNPDASAKRDVTLVDGHAAKAMFDLYEKSYSQPKPQASAFTIGIGAGQ